MLSGYDLRTGVIDMAVGSRLPHSAAEPGGWTRPRGNTEEEGEGVVGKGSGAPGEGALREEISWR